MGIISLLFEADQLEADLWGFDYSFNIGGMWTESILAAWGEGYQAWNELRHERLTLEVDVNREFP